MDYASKGVAGTGLGLGIPAIPFVSPNEKILSFSADDIDNLVAYIKGAK